VIFIFIAAIALGIAVLYLVVGNASGNRCLNVKVKDVVDGKTLEIRSATENRRVILAGIGFPPGDEKALTDAFELVEEVAHGGQFKMEILKEVDGVMYVDIRALNGDSLNELMLRKGFARFDSRAIGFVNSMLTAESVAKNAKAGIWNRQRELFRNASNSLADNGVMGDNSRMIDQLDEDESLRL
jgi:endonuclease YncB( thermonuclease family)|tara:strand:+ start:850 stop:1404 length:555 start_codon:yes stop_codon:yes gene_type:complete